MAAAEASYAKLSARVDAHRAAAERTTRVVMPAASAAVAEGMGRARQEMGAFVTERIRQDVAVHAELLGCRQATVRSLVARGLEALRTTPEVIA